MPTIADVIDYQIENNISFLPNLLQNGKQKEHDYLHWEFLYRGGRVAARMGDWKAVLYNKEAGSIKIYNIVPHRSNTTWR